MRQPFHCVVCGKKVELGLAHQACRHTCGSAECQAVYQKRYIAQVDQRRQNNRIKLLQSQGIDMVTCAVCNQQFEMIHHNHLKTHGLTVKEYKKLYPNLPTLNSRMKQTRGQGALAQSHYLSYLGKEPDHKLYEFLTGSLLGDGSLEKAYNKRNARYAEGGSNQKYLEWKHEFISQYFSCSFKEYLSLPHPKTGKRYKGWWLRTTVNPALTQLHSQWYNSKKVIPKSLILEYLTEFALIIWLCDDGCSSGGIKLYTLAFSEDEVKFLADLLKARFHLQGSILKNKNNQPFIRLNATSKLILREMTSKYIIPGMQYKLNF
ncbi:LAGLIDADG endonuclease [Calothrix sp. UHCC 0171]|uniref:LAGLIDADG endonuclease n=1 Tax=Calothrix sp. UHCC 0171 TaxID=3110245 RepID=UPI002B213B52|nr:LAGLIDADG endonuclease [Calothrix sp. UHCC 0171]MEA5574598.1 LAGLIDADG endonuclease [Calothrix sp. UHCC 0171]